MRLKYFKIFESRTAGISDDEFRKLLHFACKDFVKHPKLLQRSKYINLSDNSAKTSNVSGVPDKFSYVNPKKFERTQRKSEGGFMDGVDTRHHTLLMDNLPSWRKFPKRSQSIIGITSVDARTIFGRHRFLIIPYDGAKFGVAPSSDLWGSQVNLSYNSNSWKTYSFNDRFSQMLSVNKIPDSSYLDMMDVLQKEYDEFREKHGKEYINKNKYPWLVSDETAIGKIFYQANKEGLFDIEDAFSKFFSPDKFRGSDEDVRVGFSVMDYKHLYNDLEEWEKCEFWTDSECLLYYLGNFEGSQESLIEREFRNFRKEYIDNA